MKTYTVLKLHAHPDRAFQERFSETASALTAVWNFLVKERQWYHATWGVRLDEFTQNTHLTFYKKLYPQMAVPHSQCVQEVSARLATAYSEAYAGNRAYPRANKEYTDRFTLNYVQGGWKLDLEDGRYYLTLSGVGRIRVELDARPLVVSEVVRVFVQRKGEQWFAGFVIQEAVATTPTRHHFKVSTLQKQIKALSRLPARVEALSAKVETLRAQEMTTKLQGKITKTLKAMDSLIEAHQEGLSTLQDFLTLSDNTFTVEAYDWGVADLLVPTEGEKTKNPRFGKQFADRIGKIQRQAQALGKHIKDLEQDIAHKKALVLQGEYVFTAEDHRSLAQAKKKLKTKKRGLTRLWEKLECVRRDFAHKLSNEMIATADCIVMEEIASGKMAKRTWKSLRKAILDSLHGRLMEYLAYKCVKHNKLLVEIDPRNTSKTCNCCDHINRGLKLKDRHWVCANCGAHHDRDLNAALNIHRRGLAALLALSLTCQELLAIKLDVGKQRSFAL